MPLIDSVPEKDGEISIESYNKCATIVIYMVAHSYKPGQKLRKGIVLLRIACTVQYINEIDIL